MLIRAAVFLITLSGLVFEIGLTRIYSATIWYHFAFVAISMALLGWGLGGLAVHLLKKPWPPSTGKAAAFTMLYGLAIPGCLWVLVKHPFELQRLPLYFVTPLVPAELFRKQMLDHPRAWVFTSATLAMGEDFSHFKRELGIEEAAAHSWPSPFDFARQALLYTPKGLPSDPNDPSYTEAVVEAALPVLQASRGRAFLLFTSLRALRRAHDLLKDRIAYPLPVPCTSSG